MRVPNNYPPRHTDLDQEQGLYDVLAEVAEREGNFLEAASHWSRAATWHANYGKPGAAQHATKQAKICQEKAFHETFLSDAYTALEDFS